MVKKELLVKYGFLNDAGEKAVGELSPEDREKFIKDNGIDLDAFADAEMREIQTSLRKNKKHYTGYPASLRSNRFIFETESLNMEGMYYWVLNNLSVDSGFNKSDMIKITDVFSASEMSTYFQRAAQNLSAQQDRASQFMRGTSEMTKQMFQLIRDLNIVDEKLGYYNQSFSKDNDEAQSGEKVLKGQFADLVDGGPKNPSSVFGMAQQFGFVTLPSIFFQKRVYGKDLDEIQKNIHKSIQNEKDFGNATFKDVLERKLTQYYHWKYRTYDQLKTYRRLYKSYLKQHYNNIKMYMNWIKPYLRNINKLTMSGAKADSVELVSAFEGTMIEIEFLAKKKLGDYHAVVLANFDYRSMPVLAFDKQYQQNRTALTGRVEMTLRAYAWTDEQIENYRKMKEAEDLDLISEIDSSIKESMDSMKDDIEKYINEKEEDEKTDEEKKEAKAKYTWEYKNGKIQKVKADKKKTIKENVTFGNVFEPFTELVKGFGVFLEPFDNLFTKKKKKDSSYKAAVGAAEATVWNTYKFYKKANRHLAW